MTVRRALTFAAVAAAVAAAAAVLGGLGRAGLASAPLPAAPRVTDTTWPRYSSVPNSATTALPSSGLPSSGLPGSGLPAARPGATAAPVPAVSPAPFVQHFTDGPTAPPLPAVTSPTAPVPVPAFVDGCDHNYGTRTQCIPLTFPAGVTGRCAWLAAHGFTGLVVAGQDRQGLDPDRNGIACDRSTGKETGRSPAATPADAADRPR